MDAPKSRWDAESDRCLLLNIIEGGDLKGSEWPAISLKMKDKGYNFTHEACRQHYQKLRKEFRGGASNAKPKASPAPKAPRTPKSTTTTPRKGSKASKSFTSDSDTTGSMAHGDDDEPSSPTPLKRKRMTKTEEEENGVHSAPLFKMEQFNHPVELDDDLYY
ncbi:hypothetical protein LSUE1_G008881 [Lachnellula suecica]|uniref:Myb-like domain-containing protein n=1 Tax=Lachnellula suecica TaxID=602035 RepID=A0A8T9CDS3_9HELO|nr:hypothetical protein LSUE1_G008881 [Lachnellula suecica]